MGIVCAMFGREAGLWCKVIPEPYHVSGIPALLADFHIAESILRVNLDEVYKEVWLGGFSSRDDVIEFNDNEAMDFRFHMSLVLSKAEAPGNSLMVEPFSNRGIAAMN